MDEKSWFIEDVIRACEELGEAEVLRVVASRLCLVERRGLLRVIDEVIERDKAVAAMMSKEDEAE